jgi:penicillin amidase
MILLPILLTQAIWRDAYGVPHIQAASFRDAFFQAGYAVAQDRLWQMETSRRLARGRLSEVMGPSTLASDREVDQTRYADAELRAQFDRLSPKAKTAIDAYCDGVNAWIAEANKTGLPSGYQNAGFTPQPWTNLDSVAITVRMLQIFGRGGAGELRNMAALAYLKGQKAIGDQALDVMDDLEWFNDPEATCTVSPSDDPLAKSHYRFYEPDRQTTEARLAELPKVGLLELLGGIKLADRAVSTPLAESLSAPFQTGSYCVVVSPGRSTTGYAMMLAGPQMGLSAPSIVHEISISTPGLVMRGMDVPGIPGVLIGATSKFCWAITTGVADTEDVFYYPSDGKSYEVQGKRLDLEKVEFQIPVKGGVTETVEQDRTVDGPVLLNSRGGKSVFARKSAFWMRELESFDAWLRLWSADSARSIDRAASGMTMNFNFFYATGTGDIGWRYLGLVPKRAPGVDPRFPTPGDKKYAWQGFLSPAEMPHVFNPPGGLLANWNNKPVAWWPNFDTPTWGKIFENTALLGAIDRPKLALADLEATPERIAQTSAEWPYFKPYLQDALPDFDGRMTDGSVQASQFNAILNALRDNLFLPVTGNFLNPDLFKIAIQPSVIYRALQGQTKFDYRRGSSTPDVVQRAIQSAGRPGPFRAGSFKTFDPEPILYSNRGSYIQVVEMTPQGPEGESVLPPGIAESGDHRNDQSSLARSWKYKLWRVAQF